MWHKHLWVIAGVTYITTGVCTYPLADPLVAGGDGRALVGHARGGCHLRGVWMTMAMGVAVGVAMSVRVCHSLGVEVGVRVVAVVCLGEREVQVPFHLKLVFDHLQKHKPR